MLEVVDDGPNTAISGQDYRLPERIGDRARLNAEGGWSATLPLAILADRLTEHTEWFTVQGTCGGTVGDTEPRHSELQATPLTVQILNVENAAPPPPPPPPSPPPPSPSSTSTIVIAVDAGDFTGQCESAAWPCVPEDAGTVTVTMEIDNPPDQGGYRTCLLEVVDDGPNTAISGQDYRLPERSGDRARLHAANGWSATLPLAILADRLTEHTEWFTVQGTCGGTVGDTEPRHTELEATPLTVQIANVESEGPPPPPRPPPRPPDDPPTLVLGLASAETSPGECAGNDAPCLIERVGTVQLTISLRDPPAQGAYRTCLLEVASGPNTATAGEDYRLPERSGDRARLAASNGWRATLPLEILIDGVEEGTETLTVQGKCGGSTSDTTPRHTELAATPFTMQIADGPSSPQIASAVPDIALLPGDRLTVDLNRTFASADGEALEFDAWTDPPASLDMNLGGGMLTIIVDDDEPARTATVTLQATTQPSRLSSEDSFALTIRPPANRIAVLQPGTEARFELPPIAERSSTASPSRHFRYSAIASVEGLVDIRIANGWMTLRRAPDQEGEAIVELTASTGTGVDIVRHYRVTVLAPARPWLRGWRIGLMATSTVAAATSTAERFSSE